MNNLNLTIAAITPPDGLPHRTRKEEILELPDYLTVTAASGADELTLTYVSASEPGPTHTDKIWLKIDETGMAHGFYKYIDGTWRLMAGPGVYCGTEAPTDTNVIWLKTDSVDTPRGFYRYNSTTSAWELMAGPGIHTGTVAPTDNNCLWLRTTDGTRPRGIYYHNGTDWTPVPSGIMVSTAEPAAFHGLWLKTDDTTSIRGFRYHDGSNWVQPITTGEKRVVLSTTAPAAALREHVLWARIGTTINGLFWADTTNGYWQSVHPIVLSGRYPTTGTLLAPANTYTYTDVNYSSFPMYGTAVYADIPSMAVTIEADSRFTDNPIHPIHWGCIPGLTKFSIAFATDVDREIALRLSIIGTMRFPF